MGKLRATTGSHSVRVSQNQSGRITLAHHSCPLHWTPSTCFLYRGHSPPRRLLSWAPNIPLAKHKGWNQWSEVQGLPLWPQAHNTAAPSLFLYLEIKKKKKNKHIVLIIMFIFKACCEVGMRCCKHPTRCLLLLLLLLSRFSRVRLCATPQTAAHQAPLSLGFSMQEHWSGLPFPFPMHESENWKWSRSVVSDPQRPHGLQPPRLLRPWDFPGKSTGVECHCLLRDTTLFIAILKIRKNYLNV